jgi:alpha-L-fucosidase 2
MNDSLAKHDVVWTSPSTDQDGSIPIGNGETGANVWVDRRGKVSLLVSRTDAWDEIGRICKLGKISLELSPALTSPMRLFSKFSQRLHLADGTIEITSAKGKHRVQVKIWIDANHQAIVIDVKSAGPVNVRARIECWRTAKRAISAEEESFPIFRREPQYIYPDLMLGEKEGLRPTQVGTCHVNQDSIWPGTLQQQGLGELVHSGTDPLRNRAFGLVMEGEGFKAEGPSELASIQPGQSFSLAIQTHTEGSASMHEWLQGIRLAMKERDAITLAERFSRHAAWWHAFWDRSWIFASGTPEAELVTRGYVLQRWVTACAGRGAFPIKFNGSIFTVDTDRKYDPDYRKWGGQYWFQNTRLHYCSMLASGDLDLFQPFIKLYQDIIPLARERNKAYFNHPGWFIPETCTFWGVYAQGCYGKDRTGKLPGDPIENKYIRYHYNNTLEYLAMLLDYHAYTGDAAFLKDVLIPTAEGVLDWWEHHWRLDKTGKLKMEPTNSLETYWDCCNPAPDIAGMQWDLDLLLAMPKAAYPEALRWKWERFRGMIPALPTGKRQDMAVLWPTEEPLPPRTNCENPELYAVFPYRLYGLFKPDLELARDTFTTRVQHNHVGWSQDEIQAAMLGLADVARDMITKRAGLKHKASRFPAFWGPNFDWVPDQDHGGNLMTALQKMVLVAEGNKAIVLPAWPGGWDVDFKLHLPGKQVIQGRYTGGRLQECRVGPEPARVEIFQGSLQSRLQT